MEKFSNQAEHISGLQASIEKFKESPFSLRAGLAIVSLLSALSTNEALAEDFEQGQFSEALEAFEETYNNIHSTASEGDWSGGYKYVSMPGQPDMLEQDYPDFPRSGSGSLLMATVSVINSVDDKLFDAMAQSYSVNNLGEGIFDAEQPIVEYEIEHTEGMDIDEQIISAITDNLSHLSQVSIETEGLDHTKEDETGITVEHRQAVVTAQENSSVTWKVEEVTTENGEVTGYTVKMQAK